MELLIARLTRQESEAARQGFQGGIDHYLTTCQSCGASPNKEGCDQHMKGINILRRLKVRFLFPVVG